MRDFISDPYLAGDRGGGGYIPSSILQLIEQMPLVAEVHMMHI